MRVFDCFAFFNEWRILELRLNIMSDWVDKFIIVESVKTQNGMTKPLHLATALKSGKYPWLDKFADKIIPVAVDAFPNIELQQWTLENWQRNHIADGLKIAKANPDDIVIISDLDEIIDDKYLENLRSLPAGEIWHFRMRCVILKLNRLATELDLLNGPKVLHYGTLINFDEKWNYLGTDLRIANNAQKIRAYAGPREKMVKSGAWHFTWMGDWAQHWKKIQAICEGSSKASEDDLRVVEKRFADWTLAIKIDENFPKYLRDNLDKYADWIDAPEYVLLGDKKISNLRKMLVRFVALFIPFRKLRRKWRNLANLRQKSLYRLKKI